MACVSCLLLLQHLEAKLRKQHRVIITCVFQLLSSKTKFIRSVNFTINVPRSLFSLQILLHIVTLILLFMLKIIIQKDLSKSSKSIVFVV